MSGNTSMVPGKRTAARLFGKHAGASTATAQATLNFDAQQYAADMTLEQRIEAALARVIEPGTDFDTAAKASAEMSELIKQRSAQRVAQMETERGLRA